MFQWWSEVSPINKNQMGMKLHQIVCGNSPMRTSIESIADTFKSLLNISFPLPPRMSLETFLGSEFGKLFVFTQNRAGNVFIESVLPFSATGDDIATLLGSADPRGGDQRGGGLDPRGPDPRDAMLGTVIAGVAKLLTIDPRIGEASKETELIERIEEAFFHTYKVPIPIPGLKVLTDPGFRITREPVTGSVSLVYRLGSVHSVHPARPVHPVRHIRQQPQVSQPVINQQTQRPMAPSVSAVFSRLSALQASMRRNLSIVDEALLRGPSNVLIPDPALWSSALDTLLKQEDQGREILSNLFDKT